MLNYLIIVIIILFIVSEGLLSKQARFLFKICASLSFFIYGVSLIKEQNYSTMLLLIGLGCGVMGDIALGLKHITVFVKTCFITGLVCFLAGHIFYFIILSKNTTNYLFTSLILATALMAVMVIIQEQTTIIQPRLKFFIYSYMFFLVYLMFIAVFKIINNYQSSNLYLPIGIVLFSLSDLFLNALYFKPLSETKKIYYRRLNLILYYSAQLIIAFSISTYVK